MTRKKGGARQGAGSRHKAGGKDAASSLPAHSGVDHPAQGPEDRAAAGDSNGLPGDPVVAENQGEPAAPGQDGAAAELVPGPAARDMDFQSLTIGRRRQRRLALTLVRGSISDVDTCAYMLGVFRSVAPSGAAKVLDERLDGAITEFTARRMFSGDLGAVFTVPVGRNQLPADMVLFVGLGTFDHFTQEVQQLAAENAIRVLVRSRVDEFATVLIGSGTGLSIAAVLRGLLTGFLRGLKDADPRQRFRAISFCETDPGRFSEMKNELYQLAGSSLFDDVEITLDEMTAPPSVSPTVRVLAAKQEPVYTMVRQESESKGSLMYRVSILGAGMKAAVINTARPVNAKGMEALLRKFDNSLKANTTFQDVQKFGSEFAKQFLPEDIRTALENMKDRHIVVVHDALSARIPWETLTINNWSPAVTGGLSRRYMADNLPIATWLEERRLARTLKLLLIVNPLGDLGGAEDEGERIQTLVGASTGIEVTPLRHNEATKKAILDALRSGSYDVVHYAGHAFFDPQRPGQSGLICAGKEVLRGVDLAGLTNLPAVVFFNACEAGRVRGGKEVLAKRKGGKAPKPASQVIEESAGVAEALMRGGIANYISTYWPVSDKAAETFSTTFYQSILAGNSLGAALLAGRQAVWNEKERDWADYILYGNFDFVLKQPGKI